MEGAKALGPSERIEGFTTPAEEEEEAEGAEAEEEEEAFLSVCLAKRNCAVAEK